MNGELRHDEACDCDVLVVGCLVGLAASMFMAQQGLRVWVVERHAATSSHPKLRGVSARTMELYRSAGIEDAIRAPGMVWSPSTVGTRTPATPPSRITARYFVAADGARGTIRASLGIGRHGTGYFPRPPRRAYSSGLRRDLLAGPIHPLGSSTGGQRRPTTRTPPENLDHTG